MIGLATLEVGQFMTEEDNAVNFQYLNYDTDPRPNVFVLGQWGHPSTGNSLLAGINLNYLSHAQTKKLYSEVDNILRRNDAKSRYRYLRRVLPDVALFYRTYDKKYIRSLSPSSFGLKATEKQEDDSEAARDAWTLKRRLYDKKGKRNKPEGSVDPKKDKEVLRAKLNKYKQQRKALLKKKRQAALIALTKELEKDISAAPKQSELGDVYESSNAGFTIWPDKQQYIISHSMPNLSVLGEGKANAIYDTVSKKMIVDSADLHFMLHDAGWDYDHVVMFEADSEDIMVSSECSEVLINEAIGELRTSGADRILTESR